jgi:hypothetical protein
MSAPLQSAYIRQSRDVRDNAWIVYDEAGNELAELPKHLDPQQAMSYLHFARRFELAALQEGFADGGRMIRANFEAAIAVLRMQIEQLEQQNIHLSTILNLHMEGS